MTVDVADGVKVAVPVGGVRVNEGVAVDVAVAVLVDVGTSVSVLVAVAVLVAVGVGVRVDVCVDVGLEVDVACGVTDGTAGKSGVLVTVAVGWGVTGVAVTPGRVGVGSNFGTSAKGEARAAAANQTKASKRTNTKSAFFISLSPFKRSLDLTVGVGSLPVFQPQRWGRVGCLYQNFSHLSSL